MQALCNWFIGEAGAAWIIGVLGILGAAYTWLKRPRPPKVIIQEIERLRLLDIHPSQRENLKVLYTYKEERKFFIENLEQKRVVIYNTGTKDLVEPVEFYLRFTAEDQEAWRIWRLILEDPSHTFEALDDSMLAVPEDGGILDYILVVRSFLAQKARLG